MAENDDNIKGLLQRLSSGTPSIASAEAARSSSNKVNAQEALDSETRYAEEIKKAKTQKDNDLKEAGFTDKDINNNARASEFWTGIFNKAKNVVSSVIDPYSTREQPIIAPGIAKPAEQIKDEIVGTFNEGKSLDRAIKNGIVRNDEQNGKIESLDENLPLLDQDDFLDNIKYGLGIEENRLGNKKFSMSFGGNQAEWFFYLDKDEEGNDILAKTRIKNHDKLKKTGKTVLNAYGTTPFNQGFLREVGAGLANTYSGLAENLVNVNRAATNLASPLLSDDYVNDITQFSKDFSTNQEIQASQAGVGGTSEWLGAGIGQGASSIAQMAILGNITGGLGSIIAPAASTTAKFQSLAAFGAGSILNFNEAYKSALESGLSEDQAASVGVLTGAINGAIESAIGTNRLFNWMSGGGDKAISRVVLKELGEDVSEKSINRVFNDIRKGLTGDAGSFLNRVFEMPILGEALEEGVEELLQTFSQNGVENLYDVFLSGDAKEKQGKFGTKFFSKETGMEALESAFFGALLGAAGGGTKFAMDKVQGKKHYTDDTIIPMIADGQREDIDAIVKTMHSGKMITDTQREFYLNRIDQLDKAYKANDGIFATLDKEEDKEKASNIKTQALNVINDIFDLSTTNENLSKKISEINSNPDITDKLEKTQEIAKELKNNALNIKFLNDYVQENFNPREDGKIQAYEDNYLNQQEIVNNKFQRFALNQNVKDAENLITNTQSTINNLQEQLQNPENLESPKETRAKLLREQLAITVYESQKNQDTAAIQELIDNYNEITSNSYQEKLRSENNEIKAIEEVEEAEPVVTTPIEAVEEVQVEDNINTEEDKELAPINQEDKLNQEKERIQGILDNSEDLEIETITALNDQLNDIDDQLFDMNSAKQVSAQDYQAYYDEQLERARAVSKLDDTTSEPALSAIKKDIEGSIAAFNSRGIDTTSIKNLHTSISNKLLEIRNRVKQAADEQIRLEQEAKNAKKNDNQVLVSNVNFFDRLQRLPFMNSNPDFYTDVEVNQLFLNTPISDILSNVELVFNNPEDLGYTKGQVLSTFNSTSKVVVPGTIVTLSYNGKGLGNFNQTDGVTSTNPNDYNIDNEQYKNTIARNNKLNALLRSKGNFNLNAADLQNLGFSLNWNGKFELDTNVPRTLIKDVQAAKLAENGGKVYIYDQVNQLEITDGTVDMRDNPNVPPIPKDLEDRYVVLVQANNGKYYWVGAQNQVLDDLKQKQLYNYLFKKVAELKSITDLDEVKAKVSEINRYLNDNIFVSIPYASLLLTTPNATNKGYKLALKIKGQKGKRVDLDQSLYGTMNDLLTKLGLDNTNLRTTLANNAPAKETINKLTINLTENIVSNPLLYKQITFKFDDNKVNDVLVEAPVLDQTNEEIDEIPDGFNPFGEIDGESLGDPNVAIDEIIEETPIILETKGETYVDLIRIINPTFDQLDENNMRGALIEASQLLNGYEDLSKIKKKGVETKVRAIVNKYNPSSSDPVFSIGEAQEIVDYPSAVEWINNNLPSTISIAEVNTLLGSIKNSGTTFGAFANNTIYLSTNAEIGTQYHEAYHAVYRTLLTDKQIQVANNLAIKKYGKPTDSQLESLRKSSSVFFNYNQKQLSDLWLEEKMANDFKEYGLSNQNTSGLNSIFNKMWNWIKFVTGNMDQLQALFYNINRGKFKNAELKSNKFNQYANQDVVFSVFTKGTDATGNTITTTQLEGQGIVASLTNKYIQSIITGKVKKTDVAAKNDILDKLIADKAKFYSIDDNPYYEEYLESTGLINDEVYLENMSKNLELKRNIFVLPQNIAALKKDVMSKSKVYDIDVALDVDERQDEIDDLGEQFERDVWTIGGETSFSTVLRTYISLVTIKNTDEYGQETEDAVDFKKVYRGLVRALGGVEEDQVLPRMKALAEFDEDINATFNQLLSDTGLTREGDLNIQNITKGYDIFRKLITAFNNEKIGWYTILHSDTQSRLVESNNASSKDLQFNDWLQNYTITYNTLAHDESLKKTIYSTLDFINRSENITVNTLAEAKERSKELRSAFNKVSISLSNAYLTYSLLKKSEYANLDEEGKSFLNSFVGTEGLYDGGNIPFIVSEFKSGYNPFETVRDDKNRERGAVTRLKTIADQNALFDPTVGDSSFQNADGKTVYSIVRPSFGLVKLRWLKDATTRNRLLSEEKTKKDNFINPIEGVQLNHLLANENVDIVMSALNPSMIDGYRQTNIAGDTVQIKEGEGVTFGKFNAQTYMLSDLLMFLSNRKSLNKTEDSGKVTKVGESAMFNINQMEASNTGYGVFLPVSNFKTINQEVLDTLFNYLAQEVIRIHKVKSEFGKEGTTTWVGYNDKLGARGFKLMEFAGYNIDEFINQITSTENATAETVYEAMNAKKDMLQQAIKTKLESDVASYREALEANNIFDNSSSELPSVELIRLGFIKDKEVLKADNIQPLINDFYLNSYINTLGINNLLLDNYAKKVKNTVDWFKRAKGIIGSGPDMGAGVTKVAVYKEPFKFIDPKTLDDLDLDRLVSDRRNTLEADGLLNSAEIDTDLANFRKGLEAGKIAVADAQSYVTLDHKILQLQRWGRFPKQVADIYEKIKTGKNITWDEKGILEKNNAALNSTKTVAYNGDFYFKLSELILSPRLVGAVYTEGPNKGDVIFDKNGRVAQPKEGFEYLFNKYNAMLDQGVDQALPLSASKMATISPAEYAENGKFDFTKSIMTLENKFKRLQVETPSGKSKIIHGTQLIQLITSEQDDNIEIDFPYNPDVKTIGDLRDAYRKLLADNRLEGFRQALAYIKDPLSGEFNSKELTKKFYETIIASGSDEVLSNFFTPDHNGERQFNWNLGPVLNKAEQLFLAHFSKGVLSQKVPGLKVSLISDSGIFVKDAKTGKMRSLQHMVKDEDGNYYSECLLPPFANELLGKDPSDAKVKEVLKMFGVRIPTQDKHSMISLKVVGFLPVEYGSVGIFPKEIVFLSGADFDIDSEFIHRYDFYTKKDGTTVKYGTATTDEGKFEEYIKWNLSNNKMLASKFKELKYSDVIDDTIELKDLNDFLNFTEDKVRKTMIKNAFASLGMPSTLEEFISEKPINIGVNNNAMLLAQIQLLTNNYVRERAARIPASMDSIADARKIVERALGITGNEAISPNTPLARFNANRNNMEGKAGIGPVALANVTHSLLSSSNIEIFRGINVPTISGRTSSGFRGNFTISSDTNRKNDNISTLLSAMTDNAKEQHAKILNLLFNGLPTDTLPTASYMLSLGYTMEEVILFLNQPSVKIYTTADAKLAADYESAKENLLKIVGAIAGTMNEESDAFIKAYKEYKVNSVKDLTVQTLIDSLVINKDSNPIDIFHNDNILQQFFDLQQQAKYTQNVSALLSLNKGLKSTFDDNVRLNNILRNLQLDFLVPYINEATESYEDLISNLEDSKIIKKSGNKWIKGDDFPGFKINTNNPNKTPFDARLALINDPNTIQNIIIQKQVMDASKEFFLLNTNLFQGLTNILNLNSKELVPFFMDRANKTYLEEVYPDKYNALMQASDNIGYMVHKSGANSIGRALYNLKKDPDFRDNLLVKLLTLKNPKIGSSLVQIEFPTRIKAEGDFYTNLNNAFKELFMNPRTTEFARKLYYYSYFKDGLQFKNKSFINTIPSWVFKDVSSSLDVLNEELKGDNFNDVSSLKEGVIPTIVDMISSFARIENLARKLPAFKYNDTSIWKTKLDTKTNLSTISANFINDNTPIKISLVNEAEYLKSVKDLAEVSKSNIMEALLSNPSVIYDAGAYLTENIFTENGTLENVYSKVLKSIKGFDINGNPKTMDLAEVIEHNLTNGVYPTAYEVTYEIVKTIKEEGLSSTIISNKFINDLEVIKKEAAKSTEKSEITAMQQIINEETLQDEVVVTEQVSNTDDNLDNSENNSTFVDENPFSEITEDSLGIPEEEQSFMAMEAYQDIINDNFNMEEDINQIDKQVDNFNDDEGNPIC